MSEPSSPDDSVSSLAQARRVDAACNQFEAAWQNGGSPQIEDFLQRAPEEEHPALLRELVQLDVYHRRRRGANCKPEEYQARFPILEAKWLASMVRSVATPSRATAGPGTHAPVVAGIDPVRRDAAVGPGLPALPGYDLLRELGRGGMGVVYEAIQTSLNRRVALKVLGSGLGLTSRAVERFRREAAAAAKLHHTNIVPVYDTGEHRGVHFYALELIDGRLSVTDFGLARMLEQPGMTATGEFVGTPAYMSLEQYAILARRAGPFTRPKKWVSRNPALAAALGAVVLAVAAAGVMAYQRHGMIQLRIVDEKLRDEEASVEKRRAALERARVEAMCGNFGVAEQAMAEAELLDASTGQVRLIRRIIAFHRGDYAEAVGHAEQTVRLNASNGSRAFLALRSLLAVASCNTVLQLQVCVNMQTGADEQAVSLQNGLMITLPILEKRLMRTRSKARRSRPKRPGVSRSLVGCLGDFLTPALWKQARVAKEHISPRI